MHTLRLDLAHACRSMRSRPAAAVAIVLVLALGIGLTTAMFALADPFLLKPLPYGRPHELVMIELSAGPQATEMRVPALADWQARTDLFQHVAAYRLGEVLRLRTPAGAVALQNVDTAGDLFAVLQLPMMGPIVPPTDGSAELSVVVTAAARERLFGIESGVGRTFPRQDGGAVRVIGGLPPQLLFPRARVAPRLDTLTFLGNPPLVAITRAPGGGSFSANPFTVVARLREGVTPANAAAALAAADGAKGLTLSVVPMTIYMRRHIEPLALGALAAGLLVLTICAANVGNLLLARGIYRANEFATRAAIGARQRDLIRLLLVELVLVAAPGLASGLLFAHVVLAMSAAVMPGEYMALGTPAVTLRVATFATIAGIFVIITAIVPPWAAWQFARPRVIGLASLSEGRPLRALRFVMAALQSTLAVILLSAGALMIRSYVNLISQDTGFAPGIHVVSVSYPRDLTGAALQAVINATVDRFRRLPGVASAAAAMGPMVDDLRAGQLVRIKGQPLLAERKYVSADYFDTVGTRIISGRGLKSGDGRDAAVINESLARHYWPDGQAVGDQVVLGMLPGHVVGVAHDTFDLAWDVPPRPTIFTLLDNVPAALRVNFALRFAADSRPNDDALVREIARVNPDGVVVESNALGARLAATVKDRSFATLLLSFFAIAGIGVCAAGLVGIVTFVVARRTREIAVRMALGAPAPRIVRLVVLEAIAAAGVGGIAGLVIGRWLSATLEGLLYGVRAGDWPTTIGAGLLMMVVVAAAAAIPARRAVTLSPSAALREP